MKKIQYITLIIFLEFHNYTSVVFFLTHEKGDFEEARIMCNEFGADMIHKSFKTKDFTVKE